MKTIQLIFGSFIEVARTLDAAGTDTTRSMVMARARAMDAECIGKTESDALDGLAEVYEHAAAEMRRYSMLASRQWKVSYAEMPIASNPTVTVTVTAPSAEEAIELVQSGIEKPIRVRSADYVAPLPVPAPPAPSAPSFDDCEAVGLDGTIRTSAAPHTWEDVARAALAKLRAASPRTLDADQLTALELFAERHGRCWKERLRYCWETGNWGGTVRVAELQQVRNTFGPSWLVRFSFTKPATHRELP